MSDRSSYRSDGMRHFYDSASEHHEAGGGFDGRRTSGPPAPTRNPGPLPPVMIPSRNSTFGDETNMAMAPPPALSSTASSPRVPTSSSHEAMRSQATLPALPTLPTSSGVLVEARHLPALSTGPQSRDSPSHLLPHPHHPHRPPSASVSYPASSRTLLSGWDQSRPRASSASMAVTLSRQTGGVPTSLRTIPSSAILEEAIAGPSSASTMAAPPRLPAPHRVASGSVAGKSSLLSSSTRAEQSPFSHDHHHEPSSPAARIGPTEPASAPLGDMAGSPAEIRPATSSHTERVDMRAQQRDAPPLFRTIPPRISAFASANGTVTSTRGSTVRRPSTSGFAKEQHGKRYELVVVQSPNRARMCGFGDKDRRPLSPTLIVRLIITDSRSGRELAATDVDTSSFFLAADLVHPEELDLAPRNLLVHQHAATVSSSMLQQQALAEGGHGALQAGGTGGWSPTIDIEGARKRSISDAWAGSPSAPHGYSYDSSALSTGASAPYTTITTESYTRNFVGASVASANILKDERDRLGIFFVLQDLSVRTEGVYRIKLMLANLSGEDGQIKPGVSEALAETYTEPFTVYTPRRFPGVIEPTALSKKFAAQGVKIPVRVDRKKRRRDSVGYPGAEGDGADGGAGQGGHYMGNESRTSTAGGYGYDVDDGDDD
ncbi:unnamed protein product [Parajaminaea phylloscopi]